METKIKRTRIGRNAIAVQNLMAVAEERYRQEMRSLSDLSLTAYRQVSLNSASTLIELSQNNPELLKSHQEVIECAIRVQYFSTVANSLKEAYRALLPEARGKSRNSSKVKKPKASELAVEQVQLPLADQ
jgi:hypothetical protein